jgi:hypothetical protein
MAGPVIKLYLGQFTPAAVLASVRRRPAARSRQTCQANFSAAYGCCARRQTGAKGSARLLKSAANECYKSALEWRAAVARLKALSPQRPLLRLTRPRKKSRKNNLKTNRAPHAASGFRRARKAPNERVRAARSIPSHGLAIHRIARKTMA